MGLKEKVRNRILKQPVQVRHAEYSMIFSADDDIGHPSDYLLDLALEAVKHARSISLHEVSSRLQNPPFYPDVWPGEHYRLLAGLVEAMQPRLVLEIGTATGLSALAMKARLPEDARIVTFDLIPWTRYPGGVLRHVDFADNQLEQIIADVSDFETYQKHLPLLQDTDLIFIDAAKDGILEQDLLNNFGLTSFRKPVLLVFDDIRLWNMLKIWRKIDKPKLDITSFGHWSGTGLVEW